MPQTPPEDRLGERRRALGERLKALRKQQHLTQSAVATGAGLGRQFYNGIEAGQHNISIANLWAIADALGADIVELFIAPGTGESEPPPGIAGSRAQDPPDAPTRLE